MTQIKNFDSNNINNNNNNFEEESYSQIYDHFFSLIELDTKKDFTNYFLKHNFKHI